MEKKEKISPNRIKPSELSKQRALVYLKNAPSDLAKLRNYRRWLKEPARELEKILSKLKKKRSELKEPLLIGSVEHAILNLEEILPKLKGITDNFDRSLKLSNDYFQKLKSEGTADLSQINLDLQLFILWQDYDSSHTKLYKAFQQKPEIIPIGIKHDISIDGIRKRIKSFLKNQPDISTKKS